jgi:glutamate N-acetyltransferase/amino-acid N-acetyltransferase
MNKELEYIPSGGITSPQGFMAGATGAGIKYDDRLDLGILYTKTPGTAAALFTTNKIKAAPVLLDIDRLRGEKVSAVVMNSGYANACTGSQGMKDARAMAALAARRVGVDDESVLVASTGVIGTFLPMERIAAGISKIVLTSEGGHDIARAIMTTDTIPKEAAVKAADFTIGGMAKGAGMIHPELATMLGFLTTDAAVDAGFLREALREAADISFNMLSVDGDNSTNDMLLIIANGMAAGRPITGDSRQAGVFQRALNKVCIFLAKALARDAEGATRLIEVNVSGAASPADARRAARTIVGSSLVKAAVHGSDPNWGRVLAAAGRSGAALEGDKLELYIGDTRLVQDGSPVPYDRENIVGHLNGKEVSIKLDLHLGNAEATAWGCDLSQEYVKINAEYTT